MTEQTLIVKTTTHIYQIRIGSLDLVTESDVPALIGKCSADVWRWARCRLAKVYNGDYLPVNLAR